MDKQNEGESREARDKRSPWQRPTLNRLVANKAAGKGHIIDDGNCNGTGQAGNHNCS